MLVRVHRWPHHVFNAVMVVELFYSGTTNGGKHTNFNLKASNVMSQG